MKRPSFQFYPGDWLMDSSLRVVSVGARGAWIDMLCLMHQASPYGHLKVNHKVILTANLARIIGATLPETEGYLAELEDAGVFSREDDGCIFSRRMIRDEELRQVRADGGKLGGNPRLKEGNTRLTSKVKQNLTPSSSSSSSSSEQDQEISTLRVEVIAPAIDPPQDVPLAKIVELYHAKLPQCPRVEKVTKTRRGYIRQRWLEDLPTLDAWGNYFDDVARSKFLTGAAGSRDGRTPFVANLEWLCRPGNFAKVLEGNFHR